MDTTDNYGATPLHYAAKFGNVQVVELLIQKGARVDGTDIRGRTAAHIAGSEGDTGVLRRLIKSGANLHSADHAGNTPLHLASFNGRRAAVILLIQRGPDVVSTHNENGETPLHCAVYRSHKTIARLLIDNGADEGDAVFAATLSEADLDLSTISKLTAARKRVIDQSWRTIIGCKKKSPTRGDDDLSELRDEEARQKKRPISVETMGGLLEVYDKAAATLHMRQSSLTDGARLWCRKRMKVADAVRTCIQNCHAGSRDAFLSKHTKWFNLNKGYVCPGCSLDTSPE